MTQYNRTQRQKPRFRRAITSRHARRIIKTLQLGLGIGAVVGLGWLLMVIITLRSAAAAPVDALLVLGGSIKREIYVAELAKQYPDVPVLISKGSQDPCIRLIFERAATPLEQVWLEKCADSTFSNFFFSTPILERWKARKVKLITSENHLPRALWLGQILLGSHGIWVEPDIVVEEGIPGNQESWLKTTIDIGRALVWAVVGQFYQPQCDRLTQLTTVDLDEWQQRGFDCEHQGNLGV
ncbi:MAG: YdcF family protein [Oculatellaceae cyanobacterium bins.114]|nr:YdcF family protein [Oculatellaceae cyanobacterium bins.114]